MGRIADLDEAGLVIRPLTEEDAETSGRLGREAFGFPKAEEPYRSPLRPGGHAYGVFDGSRLLARAYDREFDSWFGGVLIPTAGIAGVAVAPEARGRGLLRPLLSHVLAESRRRGAVISGLFPSQLGIYRRLGYELITSFDQVSVPSAALAGSAVPAGVALRRAEPSDREAVIDLYSRWATAQNGPLSRIGPSFPETPQEWVGGSDGISLVERDGRLIGFCGWDRGAGVGNDAVFEVTDLIATEPDGYRALLGLVASFASIAGTITLETSGADVVRLFLRQNSWRTVQAHPYMIMILDVAAALGAIGYPPGMNAELDFTVTGHLDDDQNRGYRLSVARGRGVCEPSTDASGPTFSSPGLAVVFSGAQSCANARHTGLLTGPDHDDRSWNALFGGRQVHIRDYY